MERGSDMLRASVRTSMVASARCVRPHRDGGPERIVKRSSGATSASLNWGLKARRRREDEPLPPASASFASWSSSARSRAPCRCPWSRPPRSTRGLRGRRSQSRSTSTAGAKRGEAIARVPVSPRGGRRDPGGGEQHAPKEQTDATACVLRVRAGASAGARRPQGGADGGHARRRRSRDRSRGRRASGRSTARSRGSS